VSLTPAQFQRVFGNALSEAESDAIYARYAIPSPGRVLFDVFLANLTPRSAAQVDVANPHRGPLLILGGEEDELVPEAISRAAHRRYRRTLTVNDYKAFPKRGHSLVADHGWREVAEVTLEWLAAKGLAPLMAFPT
jgi:pimeloyl-ACP methyl ester carboxylesterase